MTITNSISLRLYQIFMQTIYTTHAFYKSDKLPIVSAQRRKQSIKTIIENIHSNNIFSTFKYRETSILTFFTAREITFSVILYKQVYNVITQCLKNVPCLLYI